MCLKLSTCRQQGAAMGDLPYVEWLAREYMKKGEISRCWSDYLKVYNIINSD